LGKSSKSHTGNNDGIVAAFSAVLLSIRRFGSQAIVGSVSGRKDRLATLLTGKAHYAAALAHLIGAESDVQTTGTCPAPVGLMARRSVG
jgi:hypothetical protein